MHGWWTYSVGVEFLAGILQEMVAQFLGRRKVIVDGLAVVMLDGCDDLAEDSLATDDTDACVKAIREAGYKITVEPTDLTIPAETPFPVRIAFAVGPCGESIELFKEC